MKILVTYEPIKFVRKSVSFTKEKFVKREILSIKKFFSQM